MKIDLEELERKGREISRPLQPLGYRSVTGGAMTVGETTKRCPHCDTPLEFVGLLDGQRFVFTAHTEDSCVRATRDRVRMLAMALEQQRETYERAIAKWTRSVDDVFATHGLPSLAKQAEVAQLRVQVALQDTIDPRMAEPFKSPPWRRPCRACNDAALDERSRCRACGRQGPCGAVVP